MKGLYLVLIFVAGLALGKADFAVGAEGGPRSESRKFKEAVVLLETWIQSVLDFNRLPGLAIAVVHDQEIVYANGFGHLDVEKQVPATPGTIFSICSISKIFTAMAVMQLRDEGRLSLEDPVSRHLPWFSPEGEDAAQPVSLRDLLRHSGGLPCEPDFDVWDDPRQLYPARDDLIARVEHLKLSYPVNTQFNYSNLGYSLLGAVVSAVSGLTFEDYVRQQIIEPLGLADTSTNTPGHVLGDRLAKGYGRWPRRGSRAVMQNIDARAIAPALGFSSTVMDLAEFAKWQFRVLDGNEDRVLSRQTLQEMQTADWTNPKWGLGFSIWDVEGKEIVGHQGGCPGYKSQIILCPPEKIAVAVMVNATDAPQFTLAVVAYEIMSAALNAEVDELGGSNDWSRFTGYYTGDRSWSEAEVLEWEGDLAILWIPAFSPLRSLVRLNHVEGGIFRQDNGEGGPGKHYVFAVDDAGNISMKFNNNILRKTAR